MSDRLNALLTDLHRELGRANTLDDESRRLLAMVLSDIEKLGIATTATPGGLELLAVRFEAEHPSVAAALRQVGDVLGKAGI